MAFSFSRLIISESKSDKVYLEALKIITACNVNWRKIGTASCVGKIDTYDVWIGFKNGVSAWKCSCADQGACSHSIALSLVWDRSRNVPDPTAEDCIILCKNK